MDKKPREMALKTFLAHFTSDRRADRRFCFIIGAGASKQSGIPTGGELAGSWLKEIKDLYPTNDVSSWMQKEGIDENNPASHYPQIYDKRFEIDPKEGFSFLANSMEGREPSCGYSVLVQILADGKHNVAITTNFDSMLEDAMFTYTQKKPLICGHESLTGFISPIITRPLIAKIHRDLLYAPKNSTTETNELHASWQNALINILNIYTPIVIGYGGNDGSLMGFLEALGKIEGGIFWFYRKKDGEPAVKIQALVAKHNGYLIPIEGFDEMMLQFNTQLGFGLLDEKLQELARQRAQRYKDQIENIRKHEEKGSDTAVALDATISKRKKDWWTVQLAASEEKDIEKKNEIYIKGIEEYPESHELIGSYALFLKNIRKDYDLAEAYYKKALELDPNDAIYNGNYALFQHYIRRDYDRAEAYYKKQLEFTLKEAIAIGNYAVLLHDIRKDYDRAEAYFKKALKLDPNEANHAGNYAQFLIVRGKKEEGKSLLERAFSLKPEDPDLLAELWFYRYANFYEEYGDEAYEELSRLIETGARSIGWNFKENIELARKDGHPFVDRLEKLDKIITGDLPQPH